MKRAKHAEGGVGYRLSVAMKYRDMSVNQLMEKTGISKQSIQHLLRNDITGHLYTWSVIAEVLEVSLDWLVFGDYED